MILAAEGMERLLHFLEDLLGQPHRILAGGEARHQDSETVAFHAVQRRFAHLSAHLPEQMLETRRHGLKQQIANVMAHAFDHHPKPVNAHQQ